MDRTSGADKEVDCEAIEPNASAAEHRQLQRSRGAVRGTLPVVEGVESLISVQTSFESDEPSREIEERERSQAKARLVVADARPRRHRQFDSKTGRRGH
ncbi:MAG TPA: hypothetical protein VKU41_19825 [Polyangiaceae bacterium]|nr:hypothetical protein [Polyangiaceae bacterium]